MGPTEVNGLPAHILLVHVVVVMVPLAALALLLSTFWPAARRRLGIVTPLLALVALVAVPITTHAGEWLQARLGSSPLIEDHADLGHQLLPWAAGLFLVAAGHWARTRFGGGRPAATGPGTAPGTGTGSTMVAERTTTTTGSRVVTVVLAVLAVVAAVGSVWMVYRIGESGSRAVWDGSF